MLEITYNDVVDHLGVVVLDGLVEEEQAHGVEDGNQCHEQLKDSVRMKSFKDNSIDYLTLKHKCMLLQPYSLASYTHSPSPIHYAEINKTQANNLERGQGSSWPDYFYTCIHRIYAYFDFTIFLQNRLVLPFLWKHSSEYSLFSFPILFSHWAHLVKNADPPGLVKLARTEPR